MTSSSSLLNKNILGILDSIFVTSNKPLSITTISKILNKDRRETEKIIKEYMRYFNSHHEGIKIMKKKSFYYLGIEDKYLNIARRYMRPPPLTDKQRILLAYIYQKKEILQKDLSKIFGPTVYKDLRKLRSLGFISITRKKKLKNILFRPEAEAYIIKRKGREKLKT